MTHGITGTLLIGILLTACGIAGTESSSRQVPECSGGEPISASSAVDIARASVSAETDLSMLNEDITDKGLVWSIHFRKKPEYEHWTGCGAIVEINKCNGDIVTWYVSK